ncbi:MAG: hypothetical protein HRT41_05600 [Campylobacteraceae bacterium]|nr:hypothetical protein [Campylobacteraceae bacterium]
MSKNEILNYLKNAKIKDHMLAQICYYFSLDYTASTTAKELNLSRQTINNYYKIIRTLLLRKQEELMLDMEETSSTNGFSLKYLQSSSYVNYFIEYNEKVFIIDSDSTLVPKIDNLLNEDIKNSLHNNSKSNCAKVLFNQRKQSYLVMRMLNTSNNMQEFVDKRLKKFRGLNKENLLVHLKESQFRFNYSNEYLHSTVLSLLNLNTKSCTF